MLTPPLTNANDVCINYHKVIFVSEMRLARKLAGYCIVLNFVCIAYCTLGVSKY
ncbi:hypothetical protein HOLleu_29775 [Holothuria leucospilota]|uniref:Uncharacterized protein n=1 Tax=Holothuria leucospilota TaxID=206669 RepID=A0A9Q1H0H9_HOLLE|nr:hypothetical protein HOLleu_29775 [Holothuria leucospilota]